MADPFVCVRQRAGPFVKAFSTDRACFVRRSKDSKGLIRKRAGPAMCRTSVDKLELRLALFGYDGVFYTLTFAPEHLPTDLDGVQAVWDAFLKRLARWNRRMGRGGSPDFYVYRIEGLHGDHRYADKLGLTPTGRVRLAQKRAEQASGKAAEPEDDLYGD